MSFQNRSFVTRAGTSLLFAIITLGTGVVGAQTSASQPLTIEDVVRLKRLSDPEVSPDGR